MRKRSTVLVVAGIALAALALVLGAAALLFCRLGDGPFRPAPESGGAAASVGGEPLPGPPSSPPAGIHGVVVTAAGAPAAKARVRLFADRLTAQGRSPCPGAPPERPLLEGWCRGLDRKLLGALRSGALDAAPPLAETETDAGGRYRLPCPSGAKYLLLADREGEVAVSEEAAAPAEVALQLKAGVGRSLRVVNARDGKPVPGARASLLLEGFPPFVFLETADADGLVRFAGPLSPGDALLALEAEGFGPRVGPLALAAGAAREDVPLFPLVRVAGRVLLGRLPAAGATVQVRAPATVTDEARTATSDTEGRFQIPEVPFAPALSVEARLGGRVGVAQVAAAADPGDVTIQLFAGARLSVRVRGPPPDVAPQVALHGAGQRWELSEPPYVFEALPPGTYFGRVSAPGFAAEHLELRLGEGDDVEREVELVAGARLSGQVLDEAGAPVPGAMVVPVLLDAEGRRGSSARGFPADGEGRFEIDALRPGDYRVEARASGFEPASQRASVPALGLILTLRRGHAIRGKVVDEEGHPVQGAAVTCVREPPVPPGEPLHGHQGAATDAEGDFVVGGLRAAPYELTARADGMAQATLKVRAPAEGLRLVLERGAILTVRVVDSQGLPGRAAVTLRSKGAGKPARFAVFKEAENVHGFRSVPPGTWEVRASATGRADAVEEVELVAGSRKEITLTLGPPNGVAGKVVDEAGAPVERAYLTVRSEGAPSAEALGHDLSNRSGAFSITGLPMGEGALVLEASKPGFGTARVSVTPGVRDLRVVLTRAQRGEGRILTAEGRAPTRCSLALAPAEAAATIAASDSGPRATGKKLRSKVKMAIHLRMAAAPMLAFGGGQRSMVAADGTFSFGELPPGRQILQASCAEGWASAEVAGGSALPALQLRPGASLTVRLPSGGAWDVWVTRGPLTVPAQGPAEGAARFTGLEPGRRLAVATQGKAFAGAEIDLAPGVASEVILDRLDGVAE